MTPTLATARAFAARHRDQTTWIALAALTAAVAIGLGSSARSRLAPLRLEAVRLAAMNAEVESFRGAFRPAADVDGGPLPDSLNVGVTRAERVTLAREVAGRAEQAGLTDVRVRFAPVDTSAAPPSAPALISDAPAVANYTLTVDCGGGLAAVLALVNHLPPSVAVQRLAATSTKDGAAQYHLTLAVFETARPSPHG